jgi:hypothetical protein
MAPGKFNWFLHTMLYLQTQYILNKEKGKVPMVAEVVDGGGDDVGYDGGEV